MKITGNLESALQAKDVLVFAVPSVAVRSTAKKVAPYVKKGTADCECGKGNRGDDSDDTYGYYRRRNSRSKGLCAFRTQPCRGGKPRLSPTTCVVGAKDKETAEFLQNVFMSPVFRVYISPDILGIEMGGALKNVIALAAGTADGLGYGDNTKAALITRGITEIARLGIAMGAKADTFYGLSGIGDLIVTCASKHSRNRKAGYLMGQGRSMQQAMDEVNMVVEGVYSAKAGLALSQKYKVEMPIIEQVNKVLFEGKAPAVAVKELMVRDKKIESWDSTWTME